MAKAATNTGKNPKESQLPALLQPPQSISFAVPRALSKPTATPFALESLFSRIPDPDFVLKEAGLNRSHLRKMLGDDEISAAIETRRDALLGTPWRLEPYATRTSKFIAEQIEPHVTTILGAAFNAVPFGYSTIDPVYKDLGNGRSGIDTIIEHPFEWYEPQRDGKLKLASVFSFKAGDSASEKIIITRRNPSWLNPYGESLLSRLYWPWFFKTRGMDYWMQWLERWAQPLALGKTSGGINPDTLRPFTEDLADYLVSAVRGGAIAVNTDTDVQLLHGENSNGAQFNSLIAVLNASVQKVILGQTLTSEMPSGGGGSRAAAQVHDLVRQDKRNADIRLCHNAVQTVVNTLWSINAFSGPAPVFVQADNTGLEEARATRDAELVKAGIIRLTPKYILDRYDYREGDIEIPDPETAPLPLPAPTTSASIIPIRAAITEPSNRLTDDQMALERTIEKTVTLADKAIDREVILAAVRAASDENDLMVRLSILFHDLDQESFELVAARATNAAEIMGYVNG